MLNVSDELKQAFLRDGSHKNLTVQFEQDFDWINFYSGGVATAESTYTASNKTMDSDLGIDLSFASNSKFATKVHDHAYAVIEFMGKVSSFTSTETPSYIAFGIRVYANGVYSVVYNDAWVYPYSSFADYSKVRIVAGTAPYSRITSVYFKLLDEDKEAYTSASTCDYTFKKKDIHASLGDYPECLPLIGGLDIQVEYNSLTFDNYVLPHIGAPIDNNSLERESFNLNESICSSDILKFGACEGAMVQFRAVNLDHTCQGSHIRIWITVDDIDERVPLGRFYVSNEQIEYYNTLKKVRLEAYDSMTVFNADASDFYNSYMGGSSFLSYITAGKPGFQFTRQMGSTFAATMNAAGVPLPFKKKQDNSLTLASSSVYGKVPMNEDGTAWIEYKRYSFIGSYSWQHINFLPLYDYQTDIASYFEDPDVYSVLGKSYRDFGMSPKNGGIIFEMKSNDESSVLQSAVLDDGDFFYSKNTGHLYLLLPTKFHAVKNSQNLDLTLNWDSHLSDLKVEQYELADFSDLINQSTNLVYYNWNTLELANGSGLTYRDMIRSLMEITGGFLRYDRLGLLKYSRLENAGLYPSDALYPSDDLYPVRSGSAYLNKATYKRLRSGSEKAADYRRIQIIALNTKTYTIPYHENSKGMYYIDDNVFYSQDCCNYSLNADGTNPVPQALEMMSELSTEIEDLAYIPYEADTIGLPWVEVGDRVTYRKPDGGFEGYVFVRTLSGIQLLNDNFEAYGER